MVCFSTSDTEWVMEDNASQMRGFIDQQEPAGQYNIILELIAKVFLPNKVMLLVCEDVSFGTQIIELQNLLL